MASEKLGAILVMIHCAQNTGYAISTLERVFFDAALLAGYSINNIYFSYKKLDTCPSESLPIKFSNVIEYDFSANKPEDQKKLREYICNNQITKVLAFDLSIENLLCRILIKSGVTKIISYYGAPMSSINYGLKLFFKYCEVALRLYKPHLFIFESDVMAESAVSGRGVPRSKAQVVKLGVDTNKYNINTEDPFYIHRCFLIEQHKKVIFYSGHMEPRKGIVVIIEAAIELINNRGISDIHFVLCGNKNNEADKYISLYKGTKAENHITFGGYRRDISQLMGSSFLGVIASTGWDSFTMSSVEMASCGLPLLVSRLQGLTETIENGVTGFTFEPGDSISLANLIERFLYNPKLRANFSLAARKRAINLHDRKSQIQRLAQIISA